MLWKMIRFYDMKSDIDIFLALEWEDEILIASIGDPGDVWGL